MVWSFCSLYDYDSQEIAPVHPLYTVYNVMTQESKQRTDYCSLPSNLQKAHYNLICTISFDYIGKCHLSLPNFFSQFDEQAKNKKKNLFFENYLNYQEVSKQSTLSKALQDNNLTVSFFYKLILNHTCSDSLRLTPFSKCTYCLSLTAMHKLICICFIMLLFV